MPAGLASRTQRRESSVLEFPKQQKNKRRQSKSAKKVAMVPLRGSGAYSTPKSVKPLVKQALMELGSAAGSFLGSRVGMSSRGSALGKGLAAKISKLIGTGDYTVSERPVVNSLFPGSGGGGNGYAQFSNAAQSTRIQHREYLQDVYTGAAAGAFSITGFQINPGLAFTFPYLASVAQNFEEYRIRGMVFEFISTSSPYNANAAMGSIVMAMEYNAAAPAFTNKPQMENSDFAISARFDKNMVYGVECSLNAQNTYYVRTGNGALPLTSTDLGTMYVATQPAASFPTGSNVGELWVSYDIEFYRPRITPARFGYAHTTMAGGLATYPLLTTTKRIEYGTLTGVSYSQVANVVTLTFPNAEVGDTYQVSFTALAAGGAWSGVPTAAVGAGLAAANIFTDTSGAGYNGQQRTNAFGVVAIWYYTIIGLSPSLSLTLPSTTVNSSAADIVVFDMGNGFSAATL